MHSKAAETAFKVIVDLFDPFLRILLFCHCNKVILPESRKQNGIRQFLYLCGKLFKQEVAVFHVVFYVEILEIADIAVYKGVFTAALIIGFTEYLVCRRKKLLHIEKSRQSIVLSRILQLGSTLGKLHSKILSASVKLDKIL